MENGRDYLNNPREFDRWLKSSAVVGSIFAIAMLVMAVAGFHSAGQQDSTVAVVPIATTVR
jgi:hypothetical protein